MPRHVPAKLPDETLIVEALHTYAARCDNEAPRHRHTAHGRELHRQAARARRLAHLYRESLTGAQPALPADRAAAALRAVAAAEPIETLVGYSREEIGARCTMCGAEVYTPREEHMDAVSKGLTPPALGPAHLADVVGPVPHTDTCPWKLVTQLVDPEETTPHAHPR